MLKNERAQTIVAMFTYVSVVSLIGIYITVYAKSLHGSVVRSIKHTKGYYAAEAATIRMTDQMEQWRRAGDASFFAGTRGGSIGSPISYGPWRMPDMSLAPTSPTISNRIDFNVTMDVVYNTNQTYQLRARVSNWQ